MVLWIAGLLWGVVLVWLAIGVGREAENDYEPAGWPSDVAVVIHSFDGYVRYWDGMLYHWHKHTQHLGPYPTVIFATETLLPDHIPPGVTVLRTGPGTWAQRLRHVLSQLSHPYVLYLQEDAWLTAPLRTAYMRRMAHLMKTQNLRSLKLQAHCQHQPEHRNDFQDPLWYTVTHQPSLWQTEFLRATLYDEQEAMAHELETNALLHRYPELEQTCQCAQTYTSYQFPFVEVSRQGQLLPVGVRMLENLAWP